MPRLGALWLVIALASLWMRTGFPIYALAAAAADDALFIRIAHHLAARQWLGPYDQLTLVKGMMYPLFIAASMFAAIPLKLAEQAVWLAVSGGVAVLVVRWTRRRWLGTALFAALAFNPVLWNGQLARVIREGLYMSLSLAVLGLAVLVAFSDRRDWRGLVAPVALGITGGVFWLTREEGVWLLPALACVLVLAAFGIIARRGHPEDAASDAPRARRATGLALRLGVAALGFALTYGTVAALNARHYGVFVTNEFKSDAFRRAYGALSRIQHDHWRPYVVFPRDARLRAYAVSEAARELRPYLEGKDGEGWRRVGCEQMRLSAEACPEILSGWFLWALRDAAREAGHHETASRARAFYERLADEVDAACDAGRLDCLPPRHTLAPPFRREYLAQSLAPAATLLRLIGTFGGGEVGSLPSEGPEAGIATFRDIAGPVAGPDVIVTRRVRGWVAGEGEAPVLSLRRTDGLPAQAEHTVLPAPDVRAAYAPRAAWRFVLASDCAPGRCELVFQAPGAAPQTLPWSEIEALSALDRPGATLFVETVEDVARPQSGGLRRAVQARIAGVVAGAYAAVFPVLAAVSLAGLLAAAALRRPPPPPVTALMLGGVCAVASRVALLAYLDATSLPSANMLYASPATPFAIVAVVLGLYTGAEAVAHAYKGGATAVARGRTSSRGHAVSGRTRSPGTVRADENPSGAGPAAAPRSGTSA